MHGADERNDTKDGEKRMDMKTRDITGAQGFMDWMLCMPYETILEVWSKEIRSGLLERLQSYGSATVFLYGSLTDPESENMKAVEVETDPGKDGYRLVNGYRVREIFTGRESLTSLLTRYMERTVALNY